MLNLEFNPFPQLETERLMLKRPSIEDGPGLLEMRTSDEVMRYVERPRPESLEDVHTFILELNKKIDAREALSWSVYMRDGDRFAGSIGFWRMKPENFRAEVGYMLLPQFWRQGIATEALQRVLEFAFNQMQAHTIEADLNPDNIASAALLKKFGFEQEALFKENLYWEGKFLDTAVYTLFSSQANFLNPT